MRHSRFTIYDLRFTSLLGMAMVVALSVTAAPQRLSPIISIGQDKRLVYEADEHGNRVPDFSTCGYGGGDRSIPDVPVRVVISSVDGDETARIQKAIDYVAGLPADTNGIRGAVLLLKGRHEIFGGLQITNSAVVLRGEGMDATVLVAAGMDRRTLIKVAGKNDESDTSRIRITDDYIPVGATQFHIENPAGLKMGDCIRIVRPSTKEWIDVLGMTGFGGGIGDWRLVWKPGSRDLVWDRVIQKIDGNVVTIDSPTTTAIESSRGSRGDEAQTKIPSELPYISGYSWPGRINNVGIENLKLESAFDPQNSKDENHSWFGITMENAADCWVRQVTFEHFAGSAVAIYETCKRMTVEDCLSLAPVSEDAGWRRQTFYTMGQQTLFLRCYSERGRHDFAVGHCAAGPNAFVQCEAALAQGDSGAIESWASGMLFDNVRIDGGGLSLMNRGAAGEGAGWSAANSILWQCSASKVSVENPPGAQNWAFGCWGEFEGNGVWRESNSSVRPVSLYVAQVEDRLGADAASKIKFMPRSLEEFSNPTAEQAAKLIENSRKPAPQLSDYIAAAATRDPIRNDTAGAIEVDKIPDSHHASRIAHHVFITNGWLVCDGKLLIGTTAPINWWRGNMRPGEAKEYGINLTRFAPGRDGAGYTDDLNEITAGMISKNQAALDHHYGLWYDRRREDHERVRRVDGDVWAPFYEQPFARSGQGTAWDGLSKYDLTKFNPWYWSRLKQFADICDERSLVLFNENYFQHNILEAGAHWVDCPWRSANNINNTGFPEPPPFAGDKRIFMAEQFYDVSNPVRRELHANYIRHNLDNFTNEPNVIQFTSAEFTGPLAFEQFWLDTIAEWESGRGFKVGQASRLPGESASASMKNAPSLLRGAGETPALLYKSLVALAATKDVQDAILTDSKRAPVVDIICFRYWWQTDKGTFAPKGGQNLSPRQFERQWKGGTPSDENLAVMAAEYRSKFSKVVIASGEDADLNRGAWAFVCAGGSMPNLPRTTDPQLLAAIPHMQPWLADGTNKVWALREPGKRILVYALKGTELDLSGEPGPFILQFVDPQTGGLSFQSQLVPGGGKTRIPAGITWLMK